MKYNDNELLYMIKENSEFAFEILCEKYYPLIINRLLRFKVKTNQEDFIQECLMVLFKCALTYRDDLSKTFFKYLDQNIQFKIRDLLRNNKKYRKVVSVIDCDFVDNNYITIEERKEGIVGFNLEGFSELEKQIYLHRLQGYSINEISKIFNTKLKSVYNAVSRASRKSKHLNATKTIYLYNFLSPLEARVSELLSEGKKPKMIANELNCSVVVVYNAIKRIRQKNEKMIDKSGKL